MFIKSIQDLSNIKDVDNVVRFYSQAIQAINQTVNGNLEFLNMISAQLTFVFTGANEIGMAHGLSKIPSGYIDYGKSADIRIYDGTTPNTVDTIYLRSTGAGTIRVLVF